MSMSSNIIESLRNQLCLSTEEFCRLLGVNINNYSVFILSEDTSHFPSRVINKLKEIMLNLEKQNLIDFKERFSEKGNGYFSSCKILKHLDKLALLDERGSEVGPVTVEFHPTNRCDHKCPACTFGISEIEKERKNISFNINLLDPLIANLKELDVRGIDISGGGEPLCHERIDVIINKFADVFDVGLVTNGNKLSDDVAVMDLILTHCKWCRISVDAGSGDVYKKMHGGHVDFERLLKTVKLFADRKEKIGSKMTLGVSFLLTPDNFLDLIRSICTFREIYGVDYFQIKPIVIAPADRVNLENMIFWDKRLFELLTTCKSYETKSFKIYTLAYKFADMLLSEDTGLPFRKCWGHPFYPTIAADGSVLICCHMLNYLLQGKENGCYGRIGEERSFKDIWESDIRYKMGEGINISLCPSNCKLSETNKILESFHGEAILHHNFIN